MCQQLTKTGEKLMTRLPCARQSATTDQRRRHQRFIKVTSVTAAVLTAIYGPLALADADANDNSGLALQEVLVTATRRTVSAQDLPISITAVTGDELAQAGIQDIAQLAHSMAGVDFTDKGPFSGVSGANLIIRGLNSDNTGFLPGAATPIVPAVATYVDDTPLFVNLRLEDVDRVEVLRGPQGTLYGSGSLGGTIRFVQNAPDLSGFDAKVEMGVGKTDDTGSPNDDLHVMLNLPVTDTFAIRLNGAYTYEAGYINEPNLYALNSAGAPIAAQPGNLFSSPVLYDKDHTNDYEYHTARVAALWQPSEAFHAQFSYYYQLGTAGGFPYITQNQLGYTQPISPLTQLLGPPNEIQINPNPVLPGGAASRLASADNGLDATHDEVNLFALSLEYDMGFATLTSASSWSHHVNVTNADETAEYENFGFFQSAYGQNPRFFTAGHEGFDDKPWAQEFRLASKTGGTFDWLGGLFYKSEDTVITENDYTPGAEDFDNACFATYGQGDDFDASKCGYGESLYTPGPTQYVDGLPVVKDDAYTSIFNTHFTDLAAFGELTAHLTSKWSLTGGSRLFRQTVSEQQVNAGFYQGAIAVTNLTLSNSWRKALWKLNTAYQLDPTNLVYATWAQGFRRGGVNGLPNAEYEFNPPYITNPALRNLAPDTADNYEVGAKGTIANRFRYSTAIYEIQWHNIQEGVDLTPFVLPSALNIGNGYSRGLELELEALITQHVSAHLDYTYDQTKFTSASPLFIGPSPGNYGNLSFPPSATGGPLPGTPLNSLAGGFEYGHVNWAGGEWRFAANAHYQSSVLPALSSTVQTVTGYTMVDTRLSYALSHWITTLYCENLTNTLGINSYQDPALLGNRAQAIISQPRTVGITVAYQFKQR
jgi:iron complex outermembrane receptor protein